MNNSYNLGDMVHKFLPDHRKRSDYGNAALITGLLTVVIML